MKVHKRIFFIPNHENRTNIFDHVSGQIMTWVNIFGTFQEHFRVGTYVKGCTRLVDELVHFRTVKALTFLENKRRDNMVLQFFKEV